MTQLFGNNLQVLLSGPITAAATAVLLQSGDGAKLPAVSAPDFIFMTLIVGYPDGEISWEIVKVTDVTGDILTVDRGQEGTVAVAWVDASIMEARPTRDTFEPLVDGTLSVTQKTASFQLALAEAFTTYDLDISAPITITVPKDATVDFDVGTFMWFRSSVPTITFAPEDGGITVNSYLSQLDFAPETTIMFIYKRAANDWVLIGETA